MDAGGKKRAVAGGDIERPFAIADERYFKISVAARGERKNRDAAR